MKIVRHGDAIHEKTEMGGWSDTPLAEVGAKKLIKNAHKIKGVKGIYSSDLERAKESAQVISQKSHVPVREYDKSLRSWNTGDLEGKDPKIAEPILDDYVKHPDKKIPDGESFDQYKTRFLKGVQRLVAKHGNNIAILTHSHGVKILNAWRAKGFPDNLALDMKVYHDTDFKPGQVEEYEELEKKKKSIAKKYPHSRSR